MTGTNDVGVVFRDPLFRILPDGRVLPVLKNATFPDAHDPAPELNPTPIDRIARYFGRYCMNDVILAQIWVY